MFDLSTLTRLNNERVSIAQAQRRAERQAIRELVETEVSAVFDWAKELQDSNAQLKAENAKLRGEQ